MFFFLNKINEYPKGEIPRASANSRAIRRDFETRNAILVAVEHGDAWTF